ncbi:MAG: amidase [Acidobacteria bacterium]|nr:amidase [Acidobacteriota bacterium]
MSELLHATAGELAGKIRRKQISSRELIEACLARYEARHSAVNAIVDLAADEALAAADEADRAVARGEASGPLHGVPLTIKSSIDVAGRLCECGSNFRRGRRAQRDAVLVSRLRRAGAVILGVTNTPDMLMSYETDNHLHGRTNHPLNQACTAGGSSGGEAAAIADGMSAGGMGSDGGGSIRVPAHFCGIFGLKPTPGVIPRTGHFPGCSGPGGYMGLIGPMARSATDLQLLLEATAGPDAGDAQSAPAPVTPPSAEILKKLRIGWYTDDGVAPVTEETRSAVERAATLLESDGFDVRPYEWTGMNGAIDCWWKLFGVAARTLVEPMIGGKEDQVHPLSWELLATREEAERMSYPEFLDAWVQRDLFSARLAKRMEDFPVLLCPVAAVPAYPHGQREWTIAGRKATYPQVFSYSQVFNMTGNPAAVVPVGRSAEGMPIGVQVVARKFADATAVAVARKLEVLLGSD